MNKAICTTLVLIGAGCMLAHSQQATTTINQLQMKSQLQTLRAASDPSGDVAMLGFPAGASASSASSLPAYSSSSAGAIYEIPVPQDRHRVFDRGFLLMNTAHLALAMLDVEMTQHCIGDHTCREANPLMPSSQAGMIGVSLGLFSYTTSASYYLKKHQSKIWWLGPTVGIGAHAVGLVSGIQHY